MDIKCTECGATAVKEEDFALFDYNFDFQNHCYKDVEFAGIVRMALCLDCIKKKYTENSKNDESWGKIILIAIISIVGSILIGVFAGGQAGGISLVLFGGVTIWMIKSKIGDNQDYKEKEERYKKASENNFQELSFKEFISRYNLKTKNEITLLNGLALSPTIMKNNSLEDILQKEELSMSISEKKQGKLREYIPINEFAQFYETNIATPMPEWIKAVYANATRI